jgi:hypothetical protein
MREAEIRRCAMWTAQRLTAAIPDQFRTAAKRSFRLRRTVMQSQPVPERNPPPPTKASS